MNLPLTDDESPWESFKGIVADSVHTNEQCIDPDCSFTEIGGNSLNMVETVVRLQKAGYDVTMDGFLQSRNLREILNSTQGAVRQTKSGERFQVKRVTEEQAELVQDLMVRCLTDHGVLHMEKYGLKDEEGFKAYLVGLWPLVVGGIAVVDEDNRLRGACWGLDCCSQDVQRYAADFFKRNPNSPMSKVSAWANYVTHKLVEKVNPEGTPGVLFVKYAYAVANHLNSPEDNVRIFYLFEEGLNQMAKENGFLWAFGRNVSPLSQDMASFFGSETFYKSQLNLWTDPSTGERPFELMPDNCYVTVDLIKLEDALSK